MTISFSSKQFPELDSYNSKQRRDIIALALQKLTAPQKVILNILKLIMLIPPFIYLARMALVPFMGSMLFVIGVYFLVMRPVMLAFVKKHLGSVI